MDIVLPGAKAAPLPRAAGIVPFWHANGHSKSNAERCGGVNYLMPRKGTAEPGTIVVGRTPFHCSA